MPEKQKAVSSKDKNIEKVLSVAFAEIDKRFGKGSVMLLGQASIDDSISVISTGSVFLDKALGIGGLPRGRIVEVFGAEASGKTTVALQTIAEAQKKGGTCAFIDAEHALDPVYTKKLGVDLDSLIISQPDYGEQALEIAEMLIRSGALDLLVIDSVAALVPKAEIEGEMGDVHMGLQARLMSQALRKLTPIVHKSKTCLLFINQVRQKINSLPFGSKETTTGGTALKFYSSIRLDVRRIGALKKGDVHIGNRVAIKVVKNKLASPFARAEVDVIFGKGIERERELFDLALTSKVLRQAGAWFYYGEEKLAQGKESCVLRLIDDQSLLDRIVADIDSKDAVVDNKADVDNKNEGN